jgi:DNA topoisomerase-3
MRQTEDGKWRVEFNEEWAKEGAKPPDAETETEEAGAQSAAAVVDAKSAA